MDLQTLCNQAAGCHQAGRFGEAERLYRQILQADSRNFFAYHMFGILRSQQGRHGEALELIATALKINPESSEALSNYGNILTILGRTGEALAAFDKALKIGPQYAETLTNRGNILWTLKRPQEALASYQAALRIKPNLLEALVGSANALRHLKRLDEALVNSDKALSLKPDSIEALNNRGAVLSELRRFEGAVACYDKALAIQPNAPSALINRGSTLQALKQSERALADLDKALGLVPNNPEALSNRGIVLSHLKRFDEALASYASALAIDPRLVEALSNRGHTLREMNRPHEALESYEAALSIEPNYCKAINSRGAVLSDLGRFQEALTCHERVLAIDPHFPTALADAASAALNLCDWPKAAKFGDEIKLHLTGDHLVVPPLLALFYDWGPDVQALCAKAYVKDISSRPIGSGAVHRHAKIRVAYMSSDFRRHPITSVVTELFELHDRSRFEIVGVSMGEDDGSEIRARVARAVDRFVDVRMLSDRGAAELLHSLEVDILVDLNGHTQGARPAILSHRAAPVQVNYMGYPGTMGADFIDYIIADKTVVPFDQQPFFKEKIVHLPDTYWACDTKRTVGESPSRREASLPDRGFVFCCFNNNRKVTPAMFDVWMRLLKAVPDSVLWLKKPNDAAMANLQREAAAREVSPSRLVFAGDVPSDVHLARHALADLFLDTVPYNAHATASDALWAGLPVMTCLGQTFAGRVAASQLNAVGLPELVASNMEDYEALALRLVRDPALLASYRNRLAQNRQSIGLFNTDLFRRHIEAAYVQMWNIAERGEIARNFSIKREPEDETDGGLACR
ncbi:MAG TPA: tetratricopeptide repeat protein [Rhizomicrobium sp.]|nr:tetratricopeptide repeat protein [Rhizomicrobium sp.]